ncbi:MAG: MocR-like transcription factor YczR [Solirubrobacteraceae bacterium]
MSFTTATRLAELLGDWRQGGSAHERLAATLRSLILDGRIPLQSRLPPERALAAAVGCSRATVTFAYNRLREEGYIESRQGAGSWVALPGGHRAATDALLAGAGLEMRIAALPAPPALDDIARDAVAELPRWLDHHGYDPLGLPPLREAIAARYTARGLPTRPEQIIVSNGALQAIDLTIRALVGRGNKVLVEIPSYPAALDALRAAGARPVAVPVSASGWDLAMLRALAREQEPALAYLIPDHQNPTGAVMDSSSRRRALHELERAGSHVLIDETFSELWLDGPATAPSAPIAGERAIIVGSLSKSVWGGLRIGWARAEPMLIRRLATARATADMASPVLEQIIATHVLREMDTIMDERRALVRVRRAALADALRAALPGWSFSMPSGGLFVWAELPGAISTSLAVRAAEHGLQITPGPRFGEAGLLERYVRLPFALAPEQLERAVAILARAVPTATAVLAPERPLTYVA